jgi:hypothetical protein
LNHFQNIKKFEREELSSSPPLLLRNASFMYVGKKKSKEFIIAGIRTAVPDLKRDKARV